MLYEHGQKLFKAHLFDGMMLFTNSKLDEVSVCLNWSCAALAGKQKHYRLLPEKMTHGQVGQFGKCMGYFFHINCFSSYGDTPGRC